MSARSASWLLTENHGSFPWLVLHLKGFLVQHLAKEKIALLRAVTRFTIDMKVNREQRASAIVTDPHSGHLQSSLGQNQGSVL